jgi:dCMP deaminase
MTKKISWDDYYMPMAKDACVKSIDPSTKHGCILVDVKHRFISAGYNGPIEGIDDSQVPLTRPLKYYYMLHSEENAMHFALKDLTGGTAYITGFPCSRCFRGLAQRGIKRIVYGGTPSKCISNEEMDAVLHMCKLKNIKMIKYAKIKC